jgi:hypothetical protein
MANLILWNARPTAEVCFETDDVATAGLRNATTAQMAAGLICPADIANGTDLYTHADFLLKLHDFDDVPHAGDFLELHIFYEFGTVYGDGEHGDVAGTPIYTGPSLHGVFPIAAFDAVQCIQLLGVPIGPHDFRVALKGTVSHDIADSDGSFLYIYRYGVEVQ